MIPSDALSHKDRNVLERSAGEEGTGAESLGGESHQTVRQKLKITESQLLLAPN